MPEWVQVIVIAAGGGMIGGSVVYLLIHYAEKPPHGKHEHRYIPQRPDEDPRCVDCGKTTPW